MPFQQLANVVGQLLDDLVFTGQHPFEVQYDAAGLDPVVGKPLLRQVEVL